MAGSISNDLFVLCTRRFVFLKDWLVCKILSRSLERRTIYYTSILYNPVRVKLSKFIDAADSDNCDLPSQTVRGKKFKLRD